jgi:hypothetical protein
MIKKISDFCKKYKNKIFGFIIIVTAIGIPLFAWVNYRAEWKDWNSMFLSYCGGIFGGITTLIALYISTTETRKIQKEQEFKEKKNEEKEKQKDEELRKREYIRIASTVMPVISVQGVSLSSDFSISIENRGLNVAKVNWIKVNGIDLNIEKSVVWNNKQTALIKGRLDSDNLKKLSEKSVYEVRIEFYDLILNRYYQDFKVYKDNDSKSVADLPSLVEVTNEDKLLKTLS